MSSEIDRRLREVMSQVLELDPASIHDRFSRADAPLWSSLNHLQMISALEEVFGITFTMKEVGEMERFDSIRRLVAARLQG